MTKSQLKTTLAFRALPLCAALLISCSANEPDVQAQTANTPDQAVSTVNDAMGGAMAGPAMGAPDNAPVEGEKNPLFHGSLKSAVPLLRMVAHCRQHQNVRVMVGMASQFLLLGQMHQKALRVMA